MPSTTQLSHGPAATPPTQFPLPHSSSVQLPANQTSVDVKQVPLPTIAWWTVMACLKPATLTKSNGSRLTSWPINGSWPMRSLRSKHGHLPFFCFPRLLASGVLTYYCSLSAYWLSPGPYIFYFFRSGYKGRFQFWNSLTSLIDITLIGYFLCVYIYKSFPVFIFEF